MNTLISLTDQEWALIQPLLPGKRVRGCRPAYDNRRYFEAIAWLARTAAKWWHCPESYFDWSRVPCGYLRLLGVEEFDAMLESLAEMLTRDPFAEMIDCMIVREKWFGLFEQFPGRR